MELNDISISENKHGEKAVIIKSNTAEKKIEENAYVNTSLVVDTNVQDKRESHVYDHLQRSHDNASNCKGRCISRFKQFKDCIMLSLIGVLFIAVIVLAIFIGLQEKSAINGEWSAWSAWETCSATCGTGMQRRNRTCSNPAPDERGKPCVGDVSETQLCDKKACEDINECASGPCKNGGVCADIVNGYNCTCQNGYKGINCETAICKNGWVHFNRSCYLFVDKTLNWIDAQENCRSLSSHLVTIESVEENNFVKQQLANRNPDQEDQYWTAGNDRQAENQWVWGNTENRVLQDPNLWHPGEPNNINDDEDCQLFYTRLNFDWNDGNCGSSFSYICEVEF